MSDKDLWMFKDVHDGDDVGYTFSLGSVTKCENELQSEEGKVEPFESEIYPVGLFKTVRRRTERTMIDNLQLRECRRRRPFPVPKGR